MAGMKEKVKKTYDLLYKYKYIIAIIILGICVFFEISGSSLGQWGEYFLHEKDKGLLLGTSQLIRADEWGVSTPMAFSQYFNTSGSFPYFGKTFRGTLTDMFIVYGQPVKSWPVIFRPFHWGYLLFAPARGLSFYWCARFLALFLISWDFGMYLFKKNRVYASAYTVLLCFSPFVAWWFGVNSLIEMLVFGQAAMLLLQAYLKEKRYLLRCLYSVLLVLSGGAFILTFYPAWQIPLGYVFLALGIGIFIREYKKGCLKAKKDIPILLLFLILLGGSMLAIFSKSSDTISLVLNSDYPGHREMTAATGMVKRTIDGIEGLVYPFISNPVFDGSTANESAGVMSFYPLGIIFALWVLFKEKKKDTMLVCLTVCSTFLVLLSNILFPSIVYKVTLLSMSTQSRMAPIAGIVNLLLLLYALYLMETGLSVKATLLFSGLITVFSALYFKQISPDLYSSNAVWAVLIILTFAGFALAMNAWRRHGKFIFLTFCVITSIVSYINVNPVRKGVDVVYKSELGKSIDHEVREDKNAVWVVDNMGFPGINFPTMFGARVLNSTQTYPSIKTWQTLDTDGSNRSIYNRYAHITAVLSNEAKSPAFELQGPDVFKVTFSTEWLHTLGVTKIFTNRDLTALNNTDTSFELRQQVGEYRVYEIVYNPRS